jgi:uncharacterized protein
MPFTPVETAIGAYLLHQATSILLYQNGTTLGASGYLHHLFSTPTKGTIAFFVGMAASLPSLGLLCPDVLTRYSPAPSTLEQALATAGVGFLVGWGTKVVK